MAIYLGIHDMGTMVTDEQMQTNWTSYKEASVKLGATAQHVHYSAEKGRAYCLTEAASAQVVQQAHDDAGVPLKEILEVKTQE